MLLIIYVNNKINNKITITNKQTRKRWGGGGRDSDGGGRRREGRREVGREGYGRPRERTEPFDFDAICMFVGDLHGCCMYLDDLHVCLHLFK